MRQAVGSTNSDWPLALVVDEVWLRTRRVLVHKLETSKLWPRTTEHKAFMREQKVLGEGLKSRLLFEVLGRSDYAYLNSEAIFGASNRRLRAKLPGVLSFGNELGAGFYGLVGGDSDNAAQAAELGSMFNLGVSIVDLICDSYPDCLEEFSGILNESTLERLGNDPRACHEFRAVSRNVHVPELRILLKIIACFYSRLHILYQEAGDMSAKEELCSLLLKAYRSEISSANSRTESFSEQVSHNKSTLPFSIIHRVACLCVKFLDEEAKRTTASLSSKVGDIFWLTDDLVDVVRDFQAGALNSILIRAGNDCNHHQGWSQDYGLLVDLLEGNFAEEVAEEIRGSVASAVELLESNSVHDDGGRFRKTLLSYVRNWME